MGAAGRTPNDLSSWTSVSPGTVDVAAGKRVIATVTITVPPDAAPGEQYAAVWAEAALGSRASGASPRSTASASGSTFRSGPGGPPAANFTDRLVDRRPHARRAADGQSPPCTTPAAGPST